MKKLGTLLVLTALTTAVIGCAPAGDPSVSNPNSNETTAPAAPVNTTN